MVLLCLQYERPQIGQILKIDRNVATIKWFDGTWNSKWKVYTYKVGKKTHLGRKGASEGDFD